MASGDASGGVGRRSSIGSITSRQWEQPEDQDNIGQELMKLKSKILQCLGFEEPPKDIEQDKMAEMANIIKTYRGIIEEEEDENAKPWVDRGAFDVTMSALILINTIIIGLEVDYGSATSREWYWIFLEAMFSLIFILEITFKLYFHGARWIVRDVWNFVTTFVALMAFVDCAILNPVGSYGTLRTLSLFRVVGLVRLVRLIRRYKALEELRLVVQGLQESFQVLLWTIVLTTVFIYVCAVLLTKQIGHNVEVYGNYRKLSGGWDHEELFGTVGRSMYTLLQAMTLDGWASKIARHTIVNQWYMTVFWVVFLLISTFGIMNIVVSVIVELMLTASSNNEKRLRVHEDKQRRMELETLREIFIMSDDDMSGQLDLAEFVEAVKNPEIQYRMRQLGLPLADAAKLFGVIDEDGSRSLTFNEFIQGCLKLKGPAQSKELLAIQAHADTLAKKMDILADSLADSERMMAALDEVTTRICKRFDMAIVSSRRKIAHSVGGSQPMKPVPRQGPKDQAPLSIGNRPALPAFPDLLR
mmetsp:Transcript_107875/g.302073  ORF Transcript_107875/g.302073 Transcript_107875/m.302073 type:complete len:529 (-) Transcript_107875:66-1652(-)